MTVYQALEKYETDMRDFVETTEVIDLLKELLEEEYRNER